MCVIAIAGISPTKDTNPHILSELLRLALERLPRKPINFESYEPSVSFIGTGYSILLNPQLSSTYLSSELAGDSTNQMKMLEEMLGHIEPGERQLVGLIVNLVKRLQSANESNSADEILANIFAPLLVDGRWLAYRKPPTVKLLHPLEL